MLECRLVQVQFIGRKWFSGFDAMLRDDSKVSINRSATNEM